MVSAGMLNRSATETTALHRSSVPSAKLSLWKRLCCHSAKSDGFTVIATCFFIFTIAITCSLVFQIHFGSSEVTPSGAVASDSEICSKIGTQAIRAGGSAVDATIAALLCLSVTHPHVVGPGGGGVMLIHDHKQNSSRVIDFDVSYPPGTVGVGVPGFLKGLEKAHKLYGKLPWKHLFKPAFELARDGFPVSIQLSNALSSTDQRNISPAFKKQFFPRGILPTKGQNLTRQKYAQFLADISERGSDEFYFLKYGSEIMKALKILRSNISVQHFHNYEVLDGKVVAKSVNNITILTSDPLFGGLPLLAGLDLLKEEGFSAQSTPQELYYLFIRAIGFGSSISQEMLDNYTNLTKNISLDVKLIDRFLHNHASTVKRSQSQASQVSAVDTFDLYVAAVVGLGDNFGSGEMTEHGIFINGNKDSTRVSDELTDSGYRRHSAFTPLVAFESNNVCGERVVLSSGSWVAMLQTISRMLFRSRDMTSSIAEPRIALGSEPGVLLINDFDPELKRVPTDVRTHLTVDWNFTLKALHSPPFGVNGVYKLGDNLLSHSDTRGGGLASRIQKLTSKIVKDE